MRLLFPLILFLFSSFWAFPQQFRKITVEIVKNGTESPISGASVQIGNNAGQTGEGGVTVFSDVPSGKYSIQVSSLGYVPYTDTLVVSSTENLTLTIPLIESAEKIEGIQVTGDNQSQKIKQASIRSVYIDTRAIATQATSLTDLMNRSTGIRIRQNGGLGSRPEVSVNGFQGKAIKYFKDGIPLDYLGEGYNLSALPVEMLNHVEVYKGVLPVSLGADALGGAVNLVTNKHMGSKVNAYYEIGSFQTHRAGVLASQSSADQRWFYGLEAFFNYAANDYKALVEVVNPDTKNKEPMRLPMFHNAYNHIMGEAFAGVRNRRWADELRFGLSGFNLKKEQQHPALMTDAYGSLHSKQSTLAPSVRYKKNILDNRLRIDQFTSFNILKTARIDTLHGSYDWFGEFTPGTQVGESRLPSQSAIDEQQWVTRTNVSYLLQPNSKLELNHVFTSAKRSGEDPLGPRLQGTDIDILSLTSTYQKHVFGLSYEQSLLDDRLQNQLMAKYYRYRASGFQNTWFSTPITDNDRRVISGDYWGITEALKYQISTSIFARASVEYTYRLPEREELFGNNIFIVPNFELDPEQSLNLNLGVQTQPNESLTLEANTFFRNTKGLILLVPIQAPNAQYQNQENVRGYGVDLDINYQLTEQYTINGNATWQDLRLYGITNALDTWKNKARLRNTPYFFANLGASAKYSGVFQVGDELKVLAHYNYMREFYLETIPREAEPGGFLGLSGSADMNTNLIIPDQHLFNAGLTYAFPQQKMHLGAEVRNILNKDIYDYYRVQRPGRSFHLKLSYRFY